MTLNDRELFDFKLSMANDLKKRIRVGYKSQFRSIVISITSMPKRYKKLKTRSNASEDLLKLEDLSKSICSYLQDMFDVFGDNAILNAKRIFEDNGCRWGKRFYKNFNHSYNANDVKKLIKELHLGLKDIDYMSLSNKHLIWTFKKIPETAGSNNQASRYFNTLYEIKAIWLQHFVKAMAPGHMCTLEISEENEHQITTSISIKGLLHN